VSLCCSKVAFLFKNNRRNEIVTSARITTVTGYRQLNMQSAQTRSRVLNVRVGMYIKRLVFDSHPFPWKCVVLLC
jgi:hypothetical protein